jgi:hypothetical protein
LEAFVAAHRSFFETGAKVFADLSRTLTDPYGPDPLNPVASLVCMTRAHLCVCVCARSVRGTRLVRQQSTTDGAEAAEGGAGDDSPTPTSRVPSFAAATNLPAATPAPAPAPAAAAPPVVAKKPTAAAVPTGNLIALPGGGPAPAAAVPAQPSPTPVVAARLSYPPTAAAATAPTAPGTSSGSTAPPPRPKPRAPPAAAQERVRALFAFTPDNDDELAFAKGDVIAIVTRVDDAWYVGELNGKRGLFPSTYVGPL